MLSKDDILNNPDLQLATILKYYPQADPTGKMFKIRDENTASAKLRFFKNVLYLKDFGNSKKAQDCFAVVMEKESCDFAKALSIISNINAGTLLTVAPNLYQESDKHKVEVQISAIKNNPIDMARNYLRTRGIKVEQLPPNAYFHDKFLNAVCFIDSKEKVINRRLINPVNGDSKARMTKYTGFNPVYDILYRPDKNRVFFTEGVIDGLSFAGHSVLSIFTTSNQIKDADKLRSYIEDKEVILAFDNDDAGNKCADYYANLICLSGISYSGITRLLLPVGEDINTLLIDSKLDSFLDDEKNYEAIAIDADKDLLTKQNIESDQGDTFSTTKNQQIEVFLTGRYDIRYNSIKQQPEYKRSNSSGNYDPVDKYFLNSLRREMNQSGINTSVQNIKSILESDYASKVHPIREYFNALPNWNRETDYIKELSQTVVLDIPEIWYDYLKKWLVAVVANVMIDAGCQNHTCLVITGKQGAYKTTWLDNLCPDSLKSYLFTGKIDPQNKDSLTYIAEYLFINIDDQLRQLNKRDENELKNLITTPAVKYRRPYDIYITEYPHTASFMASVNGNDFLTDPTGSRRFLPFEAIEIDIKAAQAINMNNVYGQAYALFKGGFRYWFDHSEIERLHKHNQAFQVVSNEEQLVLEYFDKPGSRDEATDYLQSAVIQSKLEGLTRSRLSSKKLGEALTKLGFEKWQRTENHKTKWVWSVIQKPMLKVDEENSNSNNSF